MAIIEHDTIESLAEANEAQAQQYGMMPFVSFSDLDNGGGQLSFHDRNGEDQHVHRDPQADDGYAVKQRYNAHVGY